MINYIDSVKTDPSVEPVTLDEVKTHLRGISHSDHDLMLNGYIQAAREYLQQITGRAFVQQTRKVYFRDWPDNDVFKLPFAPVQSVTHLKYTDTDDTTTTFSSSYYNVNTDAEPGEVVLKYGESWPTATLHKDDYPIEIQYVCGYAPTNDSPADYRENIPEVIKSAMLMQIELIYDKPPDPYAAALRKAIDMILAPYTLWRM